MHITENNIRRIIRQTLKESLLREGAAKNWDDYISLTAAKGIPQPEEMKSLYFKIVNSDWQDHVKDGGKLLKDAGFIDGQSDSYKDYVSWYMRFNETPFGKSMRNPDGRRWLDPEDIIEALGGFVKQIDKGEIGGPEVVEVEELDPVELASKAQQRKSKRKANQKKRQDNRSTRKEKRKDRRKEMGNRISNLDIDVEGI
jgi:hypothetical protein